MILIPTAILHRPGASYNMMGGIVSSCVFDLDATISSSYGGSGQTWANLESTPADGAAQTDYDFYLGTGSGGGSDDPAFAGSAGSPAAYFSVDGGDFFSLKSGSNTAFINNLHKTTGGADFTAALAFYEVDNTTTNYLLSTNSSTTTCGLGINRTAAEVIKLFQYGDSAASNVTLSGSLTLSAPNILLVAHNHSTNKTKTWVNSTTGSAETAQTFNTTTGNASATMVIGALGSQAGSFATSGIRIYAVSMFNEYFDDTKAAAIIAEYESRHARDYTP